MVLTASLVPRFARLLTRSRASDATALAAEPWAIVARLPVELRATITLRECAGLDYTQIGVVLDLSREQVQTRIYLAREEIRRMLDEVVPS